MKRPDKARYQFWDQKDVIITPEIMGKGVFRGNKEYSETLKFSLCRNVFVSRMTIEGSREDCLDIVRGENYTFDRCTFIIRPKVAKTARHITVKGGAKNILFDNCLFIGRGFWPWQLQLGDWTDYDIRDRFPTRDITLDNCVSTLPEGLTTLSIYAEKPKTTWNVSTSGTKYRTWKLWPPLRKAYWQFKRLTNSERKDLDHEIREWEV